MDKVKTIKILYADGTYSEKIPIGAEASNIETTDGEDVETVLNTLSSTVAENSEALTWSKDISE